MLNTWGGRPHGQARLCRKLPQRLPNTPLPSSNPLRPSDAIPPSCACPHPSASHSPAQQRCGSCRASWSQATRVCAVAAALQLLCLRAAPDSLTASVPRASWTRSRSRCGWQPRGPSPCGASARTGASRSCGGGCAHAIHGRRWRLRRLQSWTPGCL